MFFRQASKKFSTATGAAQQLTNRFAGIITPVVFYSRVTLSFLGQVATHSKLGFPDIANATQGISGFISAFTSGAWRNVTISQTIELLTTGVKIGGFFVVGEIIGRGSVIGYHIPGTDHALAGDHH